MKSEALAETASSATRGHIAPFGKYLLLQRVSVGGMAEVFKALPEGATRIDQIVAIKRILPNIAEDNEFIGMFVDEARLAGQLNHPNICRIYELGRVGDDHYIAMQFLWGRDLLKVMNRFKKAGQSLPAPVAAFIASKAAAALHYAHTKRDATGKPLQIIHRDVSPQNIIVGYSGQVKLIDFGVARAASQSQKTQAGILKGKFGYMSPEMIRGLPIDQRSDVFAMGICLHEALTGSRLFYGETDFATLELVRDANVEPPSRKTPSVPRALDAIVMKALARETSDRYASAQELRTALEAFLSSHYPGFGEADVGAVMREAFHNEVAREKQRLQVFANMLENGELKRGAALPALPSDPSPPSGEVRTGGHSVVGQVHDHVTKRSHLSDAELARLSGDSVHEEKTQIFFSAAELDELREIESEPHAVVKPLEEEAERQPAISDVIMRGGAWSPSNVSSPTGSEGMLSTPRRQNRERPVTSSGTYQRVHDTLVTGPGGRAGRVAAATMSDPDEVTAQGISRRSRGWSWPMALAAAFCLSVAGYAVARLAKDRSATLEIGAVAAPEAVVRVDGVVRGNPPIRVQDLAPGVHEVELDAKGYLTARHKLYLSAGQKAAVSLDLERSARVASLAPVVERQQLAPTMEALPALDQASQRKGARRKDRGEAARTKIDVAPLGADETSSSASSDPQSTDGQGELLISTIPWSHVLIDGVDTGRDTPVRALKVEPGSHRLGLRTPDGQTHAVDIYVEPGQVVRIIRRF